MSTPAINILVLAAGPTSGEAPGDYPLCLTESGGVSLLERIVDNCTHIPNAKFTYAFLEHEVRKFHLDNIVVGKLFRQPGVGRGLNHIFAGHYL